MPELRQRWQEELARVEVARLGDPILSYLHRMNMVGFVDRAEEAWGAMVKQACAGEPMEFKTLGAKVRFNVLQEYASKVSCPWLRAQQVRYLKALLFRKFLAQPPGLLENLLALSVLPGILETYAFAGALARGAQAPERADFFVGVERCEKDLVTHGVESQVLTGSYLRFLRERWKKLRS